MNETLIERNCGAMRRFEIMKPASEKRTQAWAETRFSNFQLENSGDGIPQIYRDGARFAIISP